MCGIGMQFLSESKQSGHVKLGDLPPVMMQLKNFGEVFRERDIKAILSESNSNMDHEVDFESFLRVSFHCSHTCSS